MITSAPLHHGRAVSVVSASYMSTAASASSSFPVSKKANISPAAGSGVNTAGPYNSRNRRSNTFITIFGATGFLGRYVVNALGRTGATLHIATRGDDMSWRHLKPLTDYGKLVPRYISLKDENSVYAALEQSNVVINLIGKHYDTKHFPPTRINNTIEDSNTKSAELIARLSRRAGIHHLVHVSCLQAQPNSVSRYGKSKYASEEAVLREFPGACIVRPGTMYGEEDRFLNWYATLASRTHYVPLVDDGKAIVRPVFVGDIAHAVATLAAGEGALDSVDEIFELPGTDAFTHKQIAHYVFEQIQKKANTIDLSSGLGTVLSRTLQTLPNPILTADQLQVLRENENLTQKRQSPVEKGKEYTIRGWENLPGLVPKKFNTKALNYLLRYRVGGHFRALRDMEEAEKALHPHHQHTR